MCILLLFENVFIEYVLAPDSDCAQYIIANVKEATQLYTNGYQEWY